MNISMVAYVRKNKPSKTLWDKKWVKKRPSVISARKESARIVIFYQ
jgi:hypothetical protein